MIEPVMSAPSSPIVEAPAAVANPVVETPKEPTKFKMKVDGLTEEVDEDTIRRDYQKYRSAEKKFQEAASLRKQVDELLDAFGDGDPHALGQLRKLVPADVMEKFAFDLLNEKVTWEEMPEHERQLIMTKKELDKYKKDFEGLKTEKDNTQRAKADHEAVNWLESKLVDVVTRLEQKYGKFVLDANIVHEIARSLEAYELSRSADDPDPDFDDISEKTWKSWQNKAHKYISALPIDQLQNVLTKEQLKALRQNDLNAALAQAGRPARKDGEQPRLDSKKKQKMSVDEYFDHIQRKFGG